MRGFSLVEIIIVTAIIGIVSSIAVASYKSSRTSGEPRRNAYVFADSLRDASLRAIAMENDTSWGARLGSTSVTVFSGGSYAGRVTSRDKVYSIGQSTTTITGIIEVVFSKYSGIPNTSGTTTFSNIYASSSVYISPNGFVASQL